MMILNYCLCEVQKAEKITVLEGTNAEMGNEGWRVFEVTWA